jgi:hypothetical protein
MAGCRGAAAPPHRHSAEIGAAKRRPPNGTTLSWPCSTSPIARRSPHASASRRSAGPRGRPRSPWPPAPAQLLPHGRGPDARAREILARRMAAPGLRAASRLGDGQTAELRSRPTPADRFRLAPSGRGGGPWPGRGWRDARTRRRSRAGAARGRPPKLARGPGGVRERVRRRARPGSGPRSLARGGASAVSGPAPRSTAAAWGRPTLGPGPGLTGREDPAHARRRLAPRRLAPAQARGDPRPRPTPPVALRPTRERGGRHSRRVGEAVVRFARG